MPCRFDGTCSLLRNTGYVQSGETRVDAFAAGFTARTEYTVGVMYDGFEKTLSFFLDGGRLVKAFDDLTS